MLREHSKLITQAHRVFLFPCSAWEHIPIGALRHESGYSYWTQSVRRLGYNAEHCNQSVTSGLLIELITHC